MNSINHPLTVKWVLFGFKGRIGRKTFLLAALLLVLIQGAIFAYAAGLVGPDGQYSSSDGDTGIALVGLITIGSWLASAWALLALAVKRLHDLGLPPMLAILLVIPAIAFFAWVALAALPSKQEANEHGPVPFPRAK